MASDPSAENERQENALAPEFDARWGEIEDSHRAFVERFLSMLPADGRVLDAACGTGKYFRMVLASGRSPLGVDHSGAYLAKAGAKFPGVPTEKHDLQDLPYRDEFDGVMCVDAMEFVPPEDWPGILDHHYPAMEQVRTWVADAGFALEEEAEGPWHQEGYAYHHVLARVEGPPR